MTASDCKSFLRLQKRERAFHLISRFGVHQMVLPLVNNGTEALAYLFKCSGRDKVCY